jgi:hypothetical protein
MFAYNEFSDLLTGELVIPLKKENGKIICLDSNGKEIIKDFEEFDFDKTVEERSFVVEEEEEKEEIKEKEEKKEEPKEYSFDTNNDNDNHWLDSDEAGNIALNFGYIPCTNKTKLKGSKEFDIEIKYH